MSLSVVACGGEFQSTLPQREWLFVDLWGETEGDFNPHSHKGSDNSYLDKDCACSISIHTPTKGVTTEQITLSFSSAFQSTLPQREWLPQGMDLWIFLTISIHTPTKGVTAVRTLHRLLYFYFNPHSHKGSDNTARARSSLPCDFNPHSHKGSDVSWLLIILCKIISIHTPTKGVTQFFKRYGK